MTDWVRDVRQEFPGLTSSPQWVLCDAPGGTQVHKSVSDAIYRQLCSPSANLGGSYPSALNTIQGVARARETAAVFFNCSPKEVVFGPNMTCLTMNMARSLGETLSSTDNVVVTMLDHDANVSPWEKVAEAKGAAVRRIGFDLDDCLLDLEQLEKEVDQNTHVVAVGAASNSCGSLTPIKEVVKIVKERSEGRALVYVDAVHYAPHCLIDVQDLGCDFLVCSSYKFSGPHTGLMYGRAELLTKLQTFKLTASTDKLPGPATCQSNKWENGTQSFEAIAGIEASIKYLGSIGVRSGRAEQDCSLREKLEIAFATIRDYEEKISYLFLEEADLIPGLSVKGISASHMVNLRTPTFALELKGLTSGELAAELVKRGVACGASHFYALNFPKMFGVEGYTRIGFYHYHTPEEVARVLGALKEVQESVSAT